MLGEEKVSESKESKTRATKGNRSSVSVGIEERGRGKPREDAVRSARLHVLHSMTDGGKQTFNRDDALTKGDRACLSQCPSNGRRMWRNSCLKR